MGGSHGLQGDRMGDQLSLTEYNVGTKENWPPINSQGGWEVVITILQSFLGVSVFFFKSWHSQNLPHTPSPGIISPLEDNDGQSRSYLIQVYYWCPCHNIEKLSLQNRKILISISDSVEFKLVRKKLGHLVSQVVHVNKYKLRWRRRDKSTRGWEIINSS